MRIVRVEHTSGDTYGLLQDDRAIHALEGPLFGAMAPGKRLGHRDDLRLLAPCEPSKILCVGQNYRSAMLARGRELPTAPVIFLKTPNSVIGPEAAMLRPPDVTRFEYEGELAVVIGKVAKQVSAADSMAYVGGYTCGNDMTVRDWQQSERHWVRSKTSDTFCPLGPWIETDLDPSRLSLQVRVNDTLHQDGYTDDLIFSIPEVIEFITATITLMPGDVILTGTPLGASAVTDGDVVHVEIEGIGTLSNPVRQV